MSWLCNKVKENKWKKALNLLSDLQITSWNFWGTEFWIPTKGILSKPKVDWPCQNCTQGSTKEQPIAAAAVASAWREPNLFIYQARTFNVLAEVRSVSNYFWNHQFELIFLKIFPKTNMFSSLVTKPLRKFFLKDIFQCLQVFGTNSPSK